MNVECCHIIRQMYFQTLLRLNCLLLFERNIKLKSRILLICHIVFIIQGFFGWKVGNVSFSRIENWGGKKMRWSRNLGEFHGPRTRMKIHEPLKSKAVDIHILKMASLTLNGHHYALATNTTVCVCIHTRSREKSRATSRESRIEVRAFSNNYDDDIAPWHATIDDRLTRYHFEPFHLWKGVTRGITREGETGGRRLLRDRRTIRRH